MVTEFGRYTVEGLSGERAVRVYLPRGQTTLSQAAPVLVLFDGQNVFDDAPSFAGGWHTDVAVDRLSPKRYRVPIVVGVHHGGDARIDELGPFVVHGRGGQAIKMVDFIADTLLPQIRAQYPILEGPLGVCVGGSSMGGLAAFYAHFRRPDVFGGALCMSPSFWFGAREHLAFIETCKRPYFSRVYLDCGLREGGGRMAPLVERFAGALRRRGYDDRSLRLRIDKRGTHTELAWRRRLPAALRFMYATA